MLDPLVQSALVTAGGNLLGGLFGKSKRSGAQKQFDHYSAEAQKLQYSDYARFYRKGGTTAQYQIAAADAKKAGLHPLFALGSSANYSPSVSVAPPGQSESGSTVGDAFRSVADGAGAYLRAKAGADERQIARAELEYEKARQALVDDANIDALRARAERDRAEALQALSVSKRAQQLANHVRPPSNPDVAPPGRKAPLPTKRPTRVAPNESMPEYVEIIDDHGRRRRVRNPETGHDEISQVEYLFDRAVEAFTDGMLWMDKQTGWPLWRRMMNPGNRR